MNDFARLGHIQKTIRSIPVMPEKAQEHTNRMKRLVGSGGIRGVEMEAKQVPLTCPISRQRIQVPIRGAHCKHLECFDRDSWVNMALQKRFTREASGQCPICTRKVSSSTVEVDMWMAKVLKEMEGDAQAQRIEVAPDGSYAPARKRSRLQQDEVNLVTQPNPEDITPIRPMRIKTEVFLSPPVGGGGDAAEAFSQDTMEPPPVASQPQPHIVNESPRIVMTMQPVFDRTASVENSAARGSSDVMMLDLILRGDVWCTGCQVFVHEDDAAAEDEDPAHGYSLMTQQQRRQADPYRTVTCPGCMATKLNKDWDRKQIMGDHGVDTMADGTMLIHGPNVDRLDCALSFAGFFRGGCTQERSVWFIMGWESFSKYERDFIEAAVLLVDGGGTLADMEWKSLPEKFRVPSKR